MTNAKLIQKIRTEIERLCDEAPTCDDTIAYLMKVECFLDTLESEKPMVLEEEVKRYYSDNFDYISSDQPTLSILTNIARHFAEWGYLRAAEKYNEIEYNRQRAEECVPNDLEEAAKQYVSNIAYCDEDVELAKEQSKRDFIAGAKWQKEHSFTHHETNESLEEAVTHQMEDDGDVDDFIRKGLDKTVLKYAQIGAEWQKQHDAELIEIAYNDGITIGMTKQKEQMMKEAVEGVVTYDNFGNNVVRAGVFNNGFEIGDKVRIIIVKEESKYLEKSDYEFIKNCFENKQCYNCGLRKECEREHPDTYQPIGTCSKWTKESTSTPNN